MHYTRIPRAYWRDRMRKARAMGLNTICTYIFWNLHEPQPGKFDFTGNLDIAAFVRTAQEEGLKVIIRPGPYICTEWEFGGLPAWLLSSRDAKVRSSDSRFVAAAARYMKAVGRELAPLQITHGGPIIMTQVENEYGSFGKDKAYLEAVRQMIRAAGFDMLLYTSDGSLDYMLANGTLPDVLSVINFGGDNPEKEFANFARFRQGVPRMCGEYWIGWFDHWGEKHHVVDPASAVKGVEWMLERNISFNLYMFHGGTTFGFMNGANSSRDNPIQPDISSYDYDSPLDEAGRPTAKFFALRDAIKQFLPRNESLPELPAPTPIISIPAIRLSESTSLFSLLGRSVYSEKPVTMEELGQSYGFVLYRKKLDAAVSGKLELNEVRDYALIFDDTTLVGTLDRRQKQSSLEVAFAAGSTLNILVENLGRINFGPRLVDDRKGITESVKLNGHELTRWDMFSLPLNNLKRLQFRRSEIAAPAFHRGYFNLDAVGDSFLDLRGWGKGTAWVNGHHLGRFWKIGPQQTLFVPAPWLRRGRNEIIVLDLEDGGSRTIAGLENPIFAN